MNNDLISRQQAIDALKTDMASLDHIIKGMSGYDVRLDAYVSQRNQVDCDIDTINNLPAAQPEQRWIPVTERLPDREGRYLVSNGQIGDWVTDIDFWIHQNNRMQWKYGKKVLAWIPLPEPYQQKGEEG